MLVGVIIIMAIILFLINQGSITSRYSTERDRVEILSFNITLKFVLLS